jgi:D-alanine transaminase
VVFPTRFQAFVSYTKKMNIAYFNGKFVPKNEITVSPDDRGFLFADGVYEVVRWYQGFFYDMPGHLSRLRRSLRELRINWSDSDLYPSISNELIIQNKLEEKPVMVYFQVTRGVSPRTHSFPSPEVKPTIYSYAFPFDPDTAARESGIKVMLKEDIRWGRCDIKSIALLANTISFQEAFENGLKECIFVRNGMITEGTRSNIFFVVDSTLFTHPESNWVLSGVTRKNILLIAEEAGIKIREEALPENRLRFASEAFITNTSSEVTPVLDLGGNAIGNGLPGPITKLIGEKFDTAITKLRG